MAAAAGALHHFISKTRASKRKHGLPATARQNYWKGQDQNFTRFGACRCQVRSCGRPAGVCNFIRKTGEPRSSPRGGGGAFNGHGTASGGCSSTSPTILIC